ncbi:MAG TPA: 2-C-methyl-D-erythritol 4-phosphate cytidylyltransferase [bacterium]|nr:2-C-methyl-D-erythritol 4-phosphate cytidylyltransferase [bacterium]
MSPFSVDGPSAGAAAVVPAAGRGERLGGGGPKALIPLRGRPMLEYALEALNAASAIQSILVAAPPDALEPVTAAARRAAGRKLAGVVPGGPDRQASVACALAALPAGPSIVVVHDGARPLVPVPLIDAVVAAAVRDGAATAALRVDETVRRGDDAWLRTTVDRAGLFRVQTPQAFERTLLETAHREAERSGFRGTDDAALVERLGHPVRLVPGAARNLKVTVPDDLAVAEALLRRDEPAPGAHRVGLGFDAHRLAAGRPLVLGGVTIPSPRGLEGHSDADVIAHAVMDALLGAAGCGDIGRLFPPTEPAYRGADSMRLLARVRDLIAEHGWRAAYIDVVVMAEAPRLAPHVDAMRRAMALAMGTDPSRISIKATTLEGMGAIGREEGIAAQAVASLEPVRPQVPGPGGAP